MTSGGSPVAIVGNLPVTCAPISANHNSSWTALRTVRRASSTASRSEVARAAYLHCPHHPHHWPPRKHSLRVVLTTFFHPIKNDDLQIDFYTVYKREAAGYDMDYVKKYDEDLNTALQG